ncbi:MAG: hypothetical protein AAB683_01920 [Patescibacteria group bacterium]
MKVRPKENFGFLIEVVDANNNIKKIYFAGDMFDISGIPVTDLEVDYALIPIVTFYTFGPKEALIFVKQFKKVGEVIPMHYQKLPEMKREWEEIWKKEI